MSKVKIECNELGMCPYCNSEELEYGEMKLECNSLWYEVRCEKCGRHFVEMNEISFVGNYIGKNGDFPVVIGEEMEYEEED